MKTSKIFAILCIAIIGISLEYSGLANGQILDKLFNRNREDTGRLESEREAGVRNDGRMTSVNIPAIYDMVKSGSSLGINVLSGLVKVERGEEAERSGLVSTNGRRPLSVTVFGIPVYERGRRIGGGSSFGGGGVDDEPRPEDVPVNGGGETFTVDDP